MSIRDHLAGTGNFAAAAAVAARIRERVEELMTHPRVGRLVPEFPASSYREVIVSPYRIVYEVDDEQARVVVLRVWHGRRDLSRHDPGDAQD